jgi:hypothetical protein
MTQDVSESQSPRREYQESSVPCLPSILSLGLEDAGRIEKTSTRGMSMVDWRWAAEKGFWNRQKQCWVEEMGGKAGYLLQRGLKRNRSEFVKQQIEIYWFEHNRGRQIALNGTKVLNHVDAYYCVLRCVCVYSLLVSVFKIVF